MQGRLLPKIDGRYQAHPIDKWQDEFLIASDLGLSFIEFILDFDHFESNPLMSSDRCAQIFDLSQKTGVLVKTICADYFMEAPLHSRNKSTASTSMKVLESLIFNASKIGVTDIVLPLVDQSSVSEPELRERFISMFKPIVKILDDANINICLETDLPPVEFAELIANLHSNKITVNYDIGNSASLGYSPADEFLMYGTRISDVHVKDRIFGGSSVPLGDGDADFHAVLRGLEQVNYTGPLIMQAYRDELGIDIFTKQLDWLRTLLERFDQT
jgi:L-ribulose-5-phosphate 3-epimerase UlaE